MPCGSPLFVVARRSPQTFDCQELGIGAVLKTLQTHFLDSVGCLSFLKIQLICGYTPTNHKNLKNKPLHGFLHFLPDAPSKGTLFVFPW